MFGFLAATKQLYEWFSPSVCLSTIFRYVPVILSSSNYQDLLPLTEVIFMQNVEVKGQRHIGHKMFAPIWAFPDHNSNSNSQMATK